jgi:tetratricopeptide (TPR) repeat protein
MSETPNPYEVLGVERTAEARDIKRAYFAKVRQFPPETHPEEFQRLRAAYELLSDEEARRAYDERQKDSGPQLDPVTSARLERAVELHNEGQAPQAREVLEELLREQPQLHVARDMLGMFLLREGYAEAALARFEQLVREQPEESLYHLHKGYALHNLERHGEAVESYRRAKALDPREQRIRVALADCLTDWGSLDKALEEIDEAIAQVKGSAAPGDLRDFDLRLHRVELHLRAKAPWAAVDAELDRLVAALPETADAEMKRWWATKVGTLAAGLFGNERPDEANRLLMRCRQLNPQSSVEVAYPLQVTLDVEALPEAGKAWLASQSEPPGRFRGAVWPLLVQATLVALVGALLAWAFLSRATRDEGDSLWVGIVLTGAALALTASTRHLLRVGTSRLGSFITLHALHVLEVKWSQVVVWPLFHLRDIQLTNHRNNYAYTHTAVQLLFGKRSVVVNFNGEDVAKAWAQSVVAQRRRVLELLSRGLLEAEEGLDFIPAALLLPSGEGFLTRLKKRLTEVPAVPYGAAVAAAVLLCLLSVPVNARRADALAWGRAVNVGKVSAARDYLQRHPEGRHAEQARALIASRFQEARATLAERLHPESTGFKALRDVLEVLESKHATQVRLVYESRRDLARSARTRDMEYVTSGWFELGEPVRQSHLLIALQGVLERAMGRELPQLHHRTLGSPSGPQPVTLTVREHTRLSDAYYPVPRGPAWPALEVDWELELRVEGEDAPRHRFTVHSAPAEMLRLSAETSPDVAYDEMSRHAMEDFVARWVEAWGLPGALDPASRPTVFAHTLSASPYP